jgi:flagellar basal-body rod protein FlgB
VLRSIFETLPIAAARTALDGLTRREEAIASNVANIDTVGYRRRSVTFERALADSIQLRQGKAELATTDPRHVPSARLGGQNLNSVDPRDVIASRNDGNAVSIDEEMALLADTQVRYQALTQTLGQRLATWRHVVRGGR